MENEQTEWYDSNRLWCREGIYQSANGKDEDWDMVLAEIRSIQV